MTPPPSGASPARPSQPHPVEPRPPKPHVSWTPDPRFHVCDLCGATDTSLTLTPEGKRACLVRCGRDPSEAFYPALSASNCAALAHDLETHGALTEVTATAAAAFLNKLSDDLHDLDARTRRAGRCG